MRGVAFISFAAVANAVDVQHEDVTVGGYKCGKYQTARVYYPATTGTYPVISFAHGFNNAGTNAYACYETMNSAVAAEGYVVIVSESSSLPFECTKESLDQLRSIEWLRTSKFADMIDFSKAGLLGHSMGGGASYHNAGSLMLWRSITLVQLLLFTPRQSSSRLQHHWCPSSTGQVRKTQSSLQRK